VGKKANSSFADKTQRRRRKPEAAESEILGAAENFLRESPLRDMTIDDVMSRTGLSRPSFYEYFRDRNQLVLKLAERLGARHSAICATWLHSEQPVEVLPRVMHQFGELYAADGHLMRALVDAAGDDSEVEALYRKSMQMSIEEVAQRIRNDAEAGLTNLEAVDAEHLAGALLLMTQSYFIDKLGRRPQDDPRVVAETLAAIWRRVLYGNSH
jgi:AcrR family transcriptional regulator